MSSKEIRDIILDYNYSQEIIEEYLQEDFNTTISGICNALFYLLKFKNNISINNNLIKNLLILLEDITETENNRKNLKKIDSELKYLENKCSKYIEQNQKTMITTEINHILNIKRKIEKKKQDAEYDKVKIFENVIFQDKNLQRIETLLKTNPNILKIKDSNNENILYKILKKYISLEETQTEDINYFYQVILIFISSSEIANLNLNRQSFLENQKYYLTILEKHKDKKHIKSIIDKFLNTEEEIPLKELENKYSIKLEYPKEILKELEYFNFDNRNRYDFTNQETITIDNIGTQCRDDALYIEKNHNGTYTLYMHKPNTASLIPYDSQINKEAQFREETLYLFNKVATLFPEEISNNKCSLLENIERNTMTYIILLDSDMNIIEDSLKIVKGKIKVKHKLTYEEADIILGHKPITSLDYLLKNLAIFSLKQKNRTLKKEIYRKVENLVKENKYHESNEIDTSIAANIVHETSVLINYLPAKKFKELQLPYLYRIHGKPNNKILEQEINKIITSDLTKIDPKSLDKIKKNLQDTYLTAEYSYIPGRHYGLDKEVYSHTNGTSRLYSGTFVQYITESIIIYGDYSNKNIYLWEQRTKELSKLLNERKQKNDAFSNQYNFYQYKKKLKEKFSTIKE